MIIRGGRFGKKVCEAFLPNNSWGPSSIKERTEWQVEKTAISLIIFIFQIHKVYCETHSKLEFLPARIRSRLEKDSADLPK